mgnify:CR=1 FL=1
MSNKIQEARAQVAELTQAAYLRAVEAGKLPAGAEVKATIEIPKDTSHGDYASSYAMAGARPPGPSPRPLWTTLTWRGATSRKWRSPGPAF